MKRTHLIRKSSTNFQRPRYGVKNRNLFGLVTVLAVALAGTLATPAFAHNEFYTAVRTAPAGDAEAGEVTNFTLRITNTSTHSAHGIASVKITVPSAFTTVTLGSLPFLTSAGKCWSAIVSGNVITAGAVTSSVSPCPGGGAGDQRLAVSDYVDITFSATAPCPPFNNPYAFTTAAGNTTLQDIISLGTSFTPNYTRSGSEPTISVTGNCTTSDANMPVTKTINGESPDCTGNPPDANGNPDEARPCTYFQTLPALTLLASDPEFEIAVYETGGDGFPSATPLGPFPPFPLPEGNGPKIPPQYDTTVEPGSSFTMCETPLTPQSVFSLTEVVVNVTPDTGLLNPRYQTVYYHQGHACFNTTVPGDAEEFAVNLDNSIVCTYTQGAYGNQGSTGWRTLRDEFSEAYPGGSVVVGHSSFNTITFNTVNGKTVPENIAAYLPAGRTPKALTQDHTNPTSTESGVFGGQVLTLDINVHLGDANVFPGGGGGIGDFLVTYEPCYGAETPAVRDVLADANLALSGAGNPTACSISELNHLVDLLNNSFDNCVIGPEASILTPPPPVPED